MMCVCGGLFAVYMEMHFAELKRLPLAGCLLRFSEGWEKRLPLESHVTPVFAEPEAPLPRDLSLVLQDSASREPSSAGQSDFFCLWPLKDLASYRYEK